MRLLVYSKYIAVLRLCQIYRLRSLRSLALKQEILVRMISE